MLVNKSCYTHFNSLLSKGTFAEPIVKITLKNERKLLNKKVHFRCAVFWSKKGVLGEQSCPAGLDPASHPVWYFHGAVGKKHFMEQSKYEIAGQARNDTENERFARDIAGFSKKTGCSIDVKKSGFCCAKPTSLFNKMG